MIVCDACAIFFHLFSFLRRLASEAGTSTWKTTERRASRAAVMLSPGTVLPL